MLRSRLAFSGMPIELSFQKSRVDAENGPFHLSMFSSQGRQNLLW